MAATPVGTDGKGRLAKDSDFNLSKLICCLCHSIALLPAKACAVMAAQPDQWHARKTTSKKVISRGL